MLHVGPEPCVWTSTILLAPWGKGAAPLGVALCPAHSGPLGTVSECIKRQEGCPRADSEEEKGVKVCGLKTPQGRSYGWSYGWGLGEPGSA